MEIRVHILVIFTSKTVPCVSHTVLSISELFQQGSSGFASVLKGKGSTSCKEVNWIRSWSKAPLCLNLESRSHYGGLRELAKQIMERKLWSSRGLQVPLVLFQQKRNTKMVSTENSISHSLLSFQWQPEHSRGKRLGHIRSGSCLAGAESYWNAAAGATMSASLCSPIDQKTTLARWCYTLQQHLSQMDYVTLERNCDNMLHLPLDSSVRCQWPSPGRSLSTTWRWWRWAAAVCTEQRRRRLETWGAGRRCDGLLLVLAEAGTGRGRSDSKDRRC